MDHQNENKVNENKAETKSICGIIGENENKSYCFEIPAYQRLYEWGDSQVETLLDDCKKAYVDNKNQYFVGNVVVAKPKEGNKYALIDGQQRLTTMFLIGIYLKSQKTKSQWKKFLIYEDKEKKEGNLRISMPLRKKEEGSLKKFIEQSDDFNERLEILKREQIHQNFIDALQCIRNWFAKAEWKDSEEIENFSEFLYKSVRFVLVELANTTDLNRFFVRMNNQGKQLEKHEILKARLLSVIQKENQETYAKIWDLCSDMDRYIFQRKSDWEISKTSKEDEINSTATSKNLEQENTIDWIIENFKQDDKGAEGESNEQNQEQFKSIVDFPTFLLHTAKLYQLEKLSKESNQPEKPKSSRGLISIDKDKLLELICVNNECGDKNAKKVVISKANEAQNFIKTLLKYRILFDYFVIKRELKNQYEIRVLEEKTYRVSRSCYEDLAMVQNYLRVARAGDRQNHHHWLTAFLQKVEGKQKSNLNIDELLEPKNNISIEKLVTKNQEGKKLEELVRFLEEWDTELAKLQLYREQGNLPQQEQEGKIPSLIEFNDKLMIELTKLQLHREQGNLPQQEQEGQISSLIELNKGENLEWGFLNRGTATPRYWFYRLEYYLWKVGMEKGEDWSNFEIGGKKLSSLNIEDKDFSTIAKDYRFRNLNSIEHIQPQSKAEGEWKEKIDIFGNLALISISFNSSLNNQDVSDKFLDLKKGKNEVVSLKMWLVYHMYRDKNNENWWNIENAQKHQKQMLEILKESLKLKVIAKV